MRNIQTLTIAMLGSVGMCLLATGCAADRNKDVPESAKLVAQGEKDLAYRAPEPGTVYIFDKSGQNLLYSGKVDRDDLIKVDAMHDKILMNDRVVMDKQIRDYDAINVYFERDPNAAAMEARSASDRTVVREREVTTEPRTVVTSPPDSTITIHPNSDKVTVDGSNNSKVTVQPSNSDSNVTIERSSDGTPR